MSLEVKRSMESWAPRYFILFEECGTPTPLITFLGMGLGVVIENRRLDFLGFGI